MGINVRTKGQTGEREVATMLNNIVADIRRGYGLPPLATANLPFQRNQNQSAVGGSDLSNPYGLEIEVKRQETLAINTWWKQCEDAAARTGGTAVLIFRQNRKPWRVIMRGDIPVWTSSNSCIAGARIEIDLDTFKQWFRAYYRDWLGNRITRNEVDFA